MNESGIYQIRNIINNKIYIGSATNLLYRKSTHFQHLKKDKHSNYHLQKSFNKYGQDNFVFEVLFTCPKSELIRLEQYHFNNYNPDYNICKTAGSSLGRKPSEQTKEKQRLKRLGTKRSEETKAKMKESRKKQVYSDETKKKMSESAKRRDLSTAIRNVSYPKDGELNARATLTNEQVYNIRKDYLNGVTKEELVIKYNSKPWRIYFIITYKTFKNVALIDAA